jgi:hypothetical protein
MNYVLRIRVTIHKEPGDILPAGDISTGHPPGRDLFVPVCPGLSRSRIFSRSLSGTKDILQNKCGNFRGTWRIPYPRKQLKTYSLVFIAEMLSFSETIKYGNSPERTLSVLAYRDFS